jgi:hypothetical protein
MTKEIGTTGGRARCAQDHRLNILASEIEDIWSLTTMAEVAAAVSGAVGVATFIGSLSNQAAATKQIENLLVIEVISVLRLMVLLEDNMIRIKNKIVYLEADTSNGRRASPQYFRVGLILSQLNGTYFFILIVKPLALIDQAKLGDPKLFFIIFLRVLLKFLHHAALYQRIGLILKSLNFDINGKYIELSPQGGVTQPAQQPHSGTHLLHAVSPPRSPSLLL